MKLTLCAQPLRAPAEALPPPSGGADVGLAAPSASPATVVSPAEALPGAPAVPADDFPISGISVGEALFNACNILLGVGVLSVPFALEEGGWAALGVLAALAVCTNYTGKALARCQDAGIAPLSADSAERAKALRAQAAAGNPLASYEDIAERAFGERGRQFIQWVLYTELLGTCGLFYILEADHLEMLFGSPVIAREAFIAASFVLFTPTTWLPDLSALSYVGLLGVVSSLGVTAVVAQDFFVGHDAVVSSTTSVAHMGTLPVTFGLLAFVFAGHAVFPNIRASMREPERFDDVLDLTYAIVGTVCLTIGACGYAAYGSKSAEEITLNLPAGGALATACSLVLVNPFAKYALTLDPVAKELERTLGVSHARGSKTRIMANAARTSLSMAALLLATSLPLFGYVMSVMGSFLTLTVSLIFPSLCYLKLYDDELRAGEKFGNWALVSVGGAAAIFGTFTAVSEILETFH